MLAPENESAFVRDELESWISDGGFARVGAKSAMARGKLKVVPARDITSARNDVTIHSTLYIWAAVHAPDLSFPCTSSSDVDAWAGSGWCPHGKDANAAS